MLSILLNSLLSILNGFSLFKEYFSIHMAIDPEVILPSSEKGTKAGRFCPKWAIYSVGGLGVLTLVALIKTLLPVIGMAFLLAYIWSQSKTTRRY